MTGSLCFTWHCRTGRMLGKMKSCKSMLIISNNNTIVPVLLNILPNMINSPITGREFLKEQINIYLLYGSLREN